MSDPVSNTRLYLGNLPRNVTKEDIEAHFATHGTGKVTDIKLMNGFGFIEYDDAMDARDVVPAFHGTVLLGERLTVQFARGPRQREDHRDGPREERRDRARPRRTEHRMQIEGLPGDTSWQDLKDFARQAGSEVVFSDTNRTGSFVEFETAADLRTAIESLDGRDFKGTRVVCTEDTNAEIPAPSYRARSRSPRRHGGGDFRRGPRDYSPRGYRDRSPPRRDHRGDRDRYRSPPRNRGPPDDDYGARRPPFEDRDRRDHHGGAGDRDRSYGNGGGRSYGDSRGSRDGGRDDRPYRGGDRVDNDRPRAH